MPRPRISSRTYGLLGLGGDGAEGKRLVALVQPQAVQAAAVGAVLGANEVGEEIAEQEPQVVLFHAEEQLARGGRLEEEAAAVAIDR
jgi:hypothetical protein